MGTAPRAGRRSRHTLAERSSRLEPLPKGGTVIAITGQLPYAERGVQYFQSVALQHVFGDVCAYQALLGAASQVPRLPQIALQTALARRQPVRIEIPADVATQTVPSNHM